MIKEGNVHIIFMGTSSFALPSLKLLLESDFKPVAVITRPDRPAGRGKKMTSPPVKTEALAHGLKVLQPQGAEELYAVLDGQEFDVLVNVAYGMILPPKILRLPPVGCINLHPSMLPAYRGAAPIQRALLAGEEYTGVTVLYMSEKMDAGDIILQERVQIHGEDDYGILHDRLARRGAELLCEALKLLSTNKAPRKEQDEDGATYAPTLTGEDEVIDWDSSAVEISKRVRALIPAPGAYTRYRGRRLKVWKASPDNSCTEDCKWASPGAVCRVDKDSIAVATGRGVLRIFEVQLEGKKKTDVESFLRGHSLLVGEKLE